MSNQQRRFTVGRCLTFCVAFAALLAALSASARANHYDVYACYAGQGTYLNPSASAASLAFGDNTGAARYLAYNQCGSSVNGIGAISVSGLLAAPGQQAWVSFTAPSGTSIERARVWRSLSDYGVGVGPGSQRGFGGEYYDGGAAEVFDGTADVPHGAAGSGDPTNNGIVPANLSDVKLAAQLPQSFAYRIGCLSSASCTTGGHDPQSPSGPDEHLVIYGAIFSVRDNATPSASLAGGGLLGGGAQHGVVPLNLSASAISGIARLELYAGTASTPSVTQDFTQTNKCSFWLVVPCQNLSNYTWPVDTTQLPNGTYYLTVKAYDPAGNAVAQSTPSQITVANQPPTGTGDRGVANGVGASDHATIARRDAHRDYTVRFGRRLTLQGRLTDERGAPIAGATLEVYDQVSGRTSFDALGHVITRSDGAWTVNVPPGPSRLIRLAYRSHQADRSYASTADAQENVLAAAHLHAMPGHVSNHERVVFHGRLLGGLIPPRGKAVEVQVQIGHNWRDVVGARADRRGVFRAHYRFTRTDIHITYRFRVVIRSETGYPYASGSSNAADVVVN